MRKQSPPPCKSVPFLEPNLDTDRIHMIYSRTKFILITIFHIFLTDFIFYWHILISAKNFLENISKSWTICTQPQLREEYVRNTPMIDSGFYCKSSSFFLKSRELKKLMKLHANHNKKRKPSGPSYASELFDNSYIHLLCRWKDHHSCHYHKNIGSFL